MKITIAFVLAGALAGCHGGVVGDGGGATAAALGGGTPIVGLAGKCLDDNGDGTGDGNKIQLWDCNGTDAQNWTYTGGQLVGPGGKCLDVQWNQQENGTPVQLWTCNGTSAQQWTMQNGEIVSSGGLCLDVTGSGTDNGTQIEIWGCHGGGNQTWTTSGGGGGGGGSGGGGNGAFRVANGRIYDPSGNEFIARGLNLYTSQTSAPLLSYFPGLNMIRLNCFDYSTTPDTIRGFVQQMTAQKVVVEIEYHQYPTLDTSPAHAQWYASMASAFAGNPYVWFGTENEPGASENGYPAIDAEHAAVYNAVRNAGNDTIIMIDPMGGYDASNLDPSTYSGMHNVVWDTHFYGWVAHYSTDYGTVQSALAQQIANNQSRQSADGVMPVIVGEFGNSTDGQSIDANADQVIGVVGGSGHGFLAWGWDPGGDQENDQLVDDAGNMTGYGQQIAALIRN